MNKIVCPKCGREYLIEEIFIPDYLLGHAKEIVRSEDGRIVTYIGTKQDLNEQYTCDKCKTTFNVTADITFNVSIDETQNVDDYAFTIYEDRMELKE